jgi:hypothetical protein
MEEKIGVKLLKGILKGGKVFIETNPKNTISTNVKAGVLKNAIVRKMGLPTEVEYDLYVRVPPDFNIENLGFDNLESIAVLPVQDDDVFDPH